jgi:hypothetical protein
MQEGLDVGFGLVLAMTKYAITIFILDHQCRP